LDGALEEKASVSGFCLSPQNFNFSPKKIIDQLAIYRERQMQQFGPNGFFLVKKNNGRVVNLTFGRPPLTLGVAGP